MLQSLCWCVKSNIGSVKTSTPISDYPDYRCKFAQRNFYSGSPRKFPIRGWRSPLISVIFTDVSWASNFALITLIRSRPFDSTAADVTRSGWKLFCRDRRIFDVEKSRGRHSGTVIRLNCSGHLHMHVHSIVATAVEEKSNEDQRWQVPSYCYHAIFVSAYMIANLHAICAACRPIPQSNRWLIEL